MQLGSSVLSADIVTPSYPPHTIIPRGLNRSQPQRTMRNVTVAPADIGVCAKGNTRALVWSALPIARLSLDPYPQGTLGHFTHGPAQTNDSCWTVPTFEARCLEFPEPRPERIRREKKKAKLCLGEFMKTRALKNLLDKKMNGYELRHRVFLMDNYECVYCGWHLPRKRISKVRTIDHIAPLSTMYDVHMDTVCHPSNMVTACLPCNQSYGSRSMFEKVFRFGRFRKPKEVTSGH